MLTPYYTIIRSVSFQPSVRVSEWVLVCLNKITHACETVVVTVTIV